MMSHWDGLGYENNIGKSYFLDVSNHATGATQHSQIKKK